MRTRYLCVLVMAAQPLSAPAASREIQELQRDVGLLQEQVKALQSSQNEKLAAIQAMVQQAIDNASKANTGVAVIQSGVGQNLKDLEKDMETKVVTPVVTLGTRMDQMSGDFRMLQNAVVDLTSIVNKLQAQLTDINNAIKVLQAPPAPPPPATTSGIPGAPGAAPAASAPTISAADLYNNALRDRTSGNLDLALQEFNQYLQWYGNTDLAANAQYYVAYIHYSQGDYDDAVKEFDLVLEKYPSDNNKIPDALYYKGMSLTRLGRRTQGAEEFKKLLKEYPKNEYSRQACDQLTSMGLRCATAGAAASKGPRRKG